MREKKLECIIVEDEVAGQKVLVGFLAIACPYVSVIGVASTVTEAKKLIDKKSPDFIMLDIRLKDRIGFELLMCYPERSFDVIIMTAHSEFEYAKTAIKYEVKDYLLKPVRIEDLRDSIGKIESKSKEHAQHALSITPLNGDTILLPHSDILMLSAEGSYTQIRMVDGEKHVLSRNLNQFEKLLPSPLFIRNHDRHIVNTSHIKSMQMGARNGLLTLTGNLTSTVSSRKRRTIAKLLKDRLGDH